MLGRAAAAAAVAGVAAGADARQASEAQTRRRNRVERVMTGRGEAEPCAPEAEEQGRGAHIQVMIFHIGGPGSPTPGGGGLGGRELGRKTKANERGRAGGEIVR